MRVFVTQIIVCAKFCTKNGVEIAWYEKIE